MGYSRRRYSDPPLWLGIVVAALMAPIAGLGAWIFASFYSWILANHGFLGLVGFMAVSMWLAGTFRGVKAMYE
jgi:hypothetical protein